MFPQGRVGLGWYAVFQDRASFLLNLEWCWNESDLMHVDKLLFVHQDYLQLCVMQWYNTLLCVCV